MNENLFLQPKEVSQVCEAVSGNKRGYLLPMIIIYMIITMIVGLGILTLGSLDRIEANKRLQREQAFYLAEAGINYARFQLKQSRGAWVPSPNPMTVNLGSGSFQLQETVETNTILVISTGTVKGVSEKTAETFVSGGNGFFSQGFFGKTKVQLDSGAKIQGAGSGGSGGQMGTNGSLTLMGSASINGTANLTGTALSGYNGTNITTVNLNYTFPDPYNPVNPANYWPAITIPTSIFGPYLSTDPRISGPGSTLVNGVLTITGGNVTITAGTGSNANFHFKEILIRSSPAVLTVIGNAVFYFDGTNGLRLMSGTFMNIGTSSTQASLVMYFSSISPLKMDAGSGITNFSGKPMDLQIYSQGTSLVLMSGGQGLQGVVFAPKATALLMSGAKFSGCIVVNDLELDSDAIATFDNIHLGSGSGITFISWTKPNWKIK